MGETYRSFATDFILELHTALRPPAWAGCDFRAVTNIFELSNKKLPHQHLTSCSHAVIVPVALN